MVVPTPVTADPRSGALAVVLRAALPLPSSTHRAHHRSSVPTPSTSAGPRRLTGVPGRSPPGGRYDALNSATYPVSEFIGPPLAGVLIGGGTPGSWVVVVTLGALAAAGGAVLLGHRLPPHVELAGR